MSNHLSLYLLILYLLSGGLLTLALLFNYLGKIPNGYQMMELMNFLRSARHILPQVSHPCEEWSLKISYRFTIL
jgi:hypothetical protein